MFECFGFKSALETPAEGCSTGLTWFGWLAGASFSLGGAMHELEAAVAVIVVVVVVVVGVLTVLHELATLPPYNTEAR